MDFKLSLFILFFSCTSSLGNPSLNSNQEGQLEANQNSNNYKEAVFVYPPGIRSERDIPVCPKWMEKNSLLAKDDLEEDNVRPASSTGGNTGSGRPLSSDGTPSEIRWESACNIVNKRYFYPPIIERLCRCPDRTECPWEWNQPPKYPGGISSNGSGSNKRDPFTIMLSSRSQAKFCAEVSTSLPRCKGPNATKVAKGEESAHLVKKIRRTVTGDEIPTVRVNCYCPPLYKRWVYFEHKEPFEVFGNGTLETTLMYKCERLPRCEAGQRCGNIRVDLHFSFYHCSCPPKHLCLPKNYPVESSVDVEEDVHEVLFDGQVAPAYCTQFP